MKPMDRKTRNNMRADRFQRIYAVVRQIPKGRVVSYGRVALIAGGVTARLVGYAMAALPVGTDVPWHRVINSQGRISPRADGEGALIQRAMLEAEGVRFDAEGRVDLHRHGWDELDIPLMDAFFVSGKEEWK